jgi:hypothetical protein
MAAATGWIVTSHLQDPVCIDRRLADAERATRGPRTNDRSSATTGQRTPNMSRRVPMRVLPVATVCHRSPNGVGSTPCTSRWRSEQRLDRIDRAADYSERWTAEYRGPTVRARAWGMGDRTRCGETPNTHRISPNVCRRRWNALRATPTHCVRCANCRPLPSERVTDDRRLLAWELRTPTGHGVTKSRLYSERPLEKAERGTATAERKSANLERRVPR